MRTAITLAAAWLLPFAAAAQLTSAACTGTLGRVTGISTSEQRIAAFDFSGSGGQLDALLATTVNVTGTGAACLLVQFSAMAVPQDNHIIFQVLVDGVPAPGQAAFPTVPGIPVVYDPEESDLNNGRMVAHSFLVPVQAGRRRVELKFAGCCSSSTGTSGVVNGATLTVLHR